MGYSFARQKGITITNYLKKIVDESNHKLSKIWVHKGSELYKISMQSCPLKNGAEKYYTHNEGKSVISEGFIRTLKNKIWKYITAVRKNVYIDTLDDAVSKCNNT